MKYCSKCGTQLDAGATVCSCCGAAQYIGMPVNNHSPSDANEKVGGWGVLGFFIPLVGLILYLVWRDDKPRRAKSAGRGALIGAIVNTAIIIIAYTIMFIALDVFVSSAVV